MRHCDPIGVTTHGLKNTVLIIIVAKLDLAIMTKDIVDSTQPSLGWLEEEDHWNIVINKVGRIR